MGEGLALGLGLGEAVPGDRLTLGLVRVGVGVACGRWVRAGACGVGLGVDDVLVPFDCPAAGLLGGATST